MSIYLFRVKALKSETPSDEVLTKPTKPPFVSFGSNHDSLFSENTVISPTVNDRVSVPTTLLSDNGEPLANVKSSWPPEAQSFIKWFMELEAPSEPFYLEPHIHVIDPAKYFASLKREIESGPSCPRGRNGALFYDLNKLRKILH